MIRRSLWFSGLAALLLAVPAKAQLNMQMGNGWNLTFSGNVNAFLVYEATGADGTVGGGALVPAGETHGFNIRTGLLPAMAVFSIKGREANRDLGATFGFAPEIQCGDGGPVSPNYVNRANCAGTQIDMRQVFMTVGGIGGGQMLFGRELSLFGRQNILQDMTLFGTGPTGGANGGGTTLGRIGFGYNYPNFNAQLTWSSATGKPSQFSVGLFDPSEVGAYTQTSVPRVEAEWTLKRPNGTMFWINALAQTATDPLADETFNSLGLGGGIKFAATKFSLVGSAFYGSGIGTTLNFIGATDGAGDARTSMGFYGQGMFNLSPMTQIGLSAGGNMLNGTDAEADNIVTNTAIVAGLYRKMSQMFRSTLEFTYNMSSADGAEDNSGYVVSAGWLLIF